LEFEGYLVARERVYGGAGRFREFPFWRRRSGVIHIDPQALVGVPSGGVAAVQSAVGSRLSREELAIVTDLCRDKPCPAHEIVAELARIGGWRRSHNRLILGIQELVEMGLLA
jgi:hypothetical protein